VQRPPPGYDVLAACPPRLASVYDEVVPPGGTRRNHRDDVHACWLLRSGRVVVRWEGGSCEARPGDWMLLPSGLLRDQVFAPRTRILSLRFRLDRGPGRPFFAGLAPVRLPGPEPGLQVPAETLLAAVDSADDGPAAAWRMQADLHRLLLRWLPALLDGGCRLAQTTDARLEAALAAAGGAPHGGDFPWREVERAAGLSRSRLDRLCRAALGTTPVRWRDGLRLEAARSLLADPHLPIKAVADRLGFADASHFAKWFRRQAGLTPQAWRQGGAGAV